MAGLACPRVFVRLCVGVLPCLVASLADVHAWQSRHPFPPSFCGGDPSKAKRHISCAHSAQRVNTNGQYQPRRNVFSFFVCCCSLRLRVGDTHCAATLPQEGRAFYVRDEVDGSWVDGNGACGRVSCTAPGVQAREWEKRRAGTRRRPSRGGRLPPLHTESNAQRGVGKWRTRFFPSHGRLLHRKKQRENAQAQAGLSMHRRRAMLEVPARRAACVRFASEPLFPCGRLRHLDARREGRETDWERWSGWRRRGLRLRWRGHRHHRGKGS